MLLAILMLMAMQVTKQEIHEWLGIGMFALVIAHHILNRKYYAVVFKGRYTPLRVFINHPPFGTNPNGGILYHNNLCDIVTERVLLLCYPWHIIKERKYNDE